MLGVAKRATTHNTNPATTLAWTELGAGPPLVLLHGLGDSHRTWRRVAPRLAKHFRVLMVDLPGHGHSDRPDAPYTLDWYARVVHGWLDAVGVESASVVGHSYGGSVAQWLVLERPERVERLALVAPGGLGRQAALGLRLLSLAPFGHMLDQAVSRPVMGLATRAYMRLGIALAARIESDELDRSAVMNAAPGTGRAFHRTVAGVMGLRGQRIQAWDRVHEVETLPPIALFWGGRDRVLPIDHAHAAQKKIEGAAFYTYPRAGHFVQLEESEMFCDDLLRFLCERSRATPRVVDPALLARWNAYRSRA